jgi:hypothetical protein
MADDDARRIDRLVKRAKELDDMIAKAAKMQKRIVDEIRRIGLRDHIRKQRMSSSEARRRKKPRG